MWGNRLGWMISLGIVVVLGGILAWVVASENAVSAPTQFTSGRSHLGKLALPVAPRKIVVATTKGNGGPVYRQAIESFQKDPDAYKSNKVEALKNLPGVLQLMQASDFDSAQIFTASPAKVINYERSPAELDALRALGMTSVRAGMMLGPKNPDAEKLIRAAFVLGARLYEERLSYAELAAGIELLGASAQQLAKLAQANGDESRANELRAFDEAKQKYFGDEISPMWRVIGSIDQRVLEEHTGDVFKIATDSEERMWRVEAILKLGRYRFNAGSGADQRGANRFVNKMAEKEQDPVLRCAAEAARNLTIEMYRMQ